MKRIVKAVLTLLLCLPFPALAAHGALSFSATLTAGELVGAVAQFDGAVDAVFVKAGDAVAAGDAIARLRTQKVYAPEDGVVAALFAAPGDDAGASSARYGGALVIEPVRKYSIYVDDKYAYENVSAMYPHLGDTVYLLCVQDGSHVGEGVITSITDEAYTVETTGGEFYIGEAVRVYNKARKYDVDRVGRGTALASDPLAVSASGAVVNCFVAVGDAVEKGQLLLETVTGLDDPSAFPGETLVSPVSGIVTSVAVLPGESVTAGSVVAQICPAEKIRAAASLSQEDLSEVALGDPVELVFESLSGEPRCAGVLSGILFLPDSALTETSQAQSAQARSEGEQAVEAADAADAADGADATAESAPAYTAYFDFEAQAGMRLGMAVTVYTLRDGADGE